MSLRRFSGVAIAAAVLCLGLAGETSAQGVGVGIKGGVVYPDFDTDALNLKNRTGWQGGLWFGGNRQGVVGVQGELNFLRKRAESELDPTQTVDVNYLQIPVLLRLHSPAQAASGFQVYGIVGPSFDIKLSESFEGVTFTSDAFKGFDIGLMFGAGVEAGRLIFEGRYSRGLKNVNDTFDDVSDIKTHSFALLAGIRFN
jgi:hypothetical protein